jgi:hypothetical protein
MTSTVHRALILASVLISCVSVDAHADAAGDKIKAMREGWERCVLFAALNKNGGAAEDAVAAAMQLCADEQARYKKALIASPIGMSEASAADATHRVHDEIEAQTVRTLLGG